MIAENLSQKCDSLDFSSLYLKKHFIKDKFFFDNVSSVLKNKGNISPETCTIDKYQVPKISVVGNANKYKLVLKSPSFFSLTFKKDSGRFNVDFKLFGDVLFVSSNKPLTRNYIGMILHDISDDDYYEEGNEKADELDLVDDDCPEENSLNDNSLENSSADLDNDSDIDPEDLFEMEGCEDDKDNQVLDSVDLDNQLDDDLEGSEQQVDDNQPYDVDLQPEDNYEIAEDQGSEMPSEISEMDDLQPEIGDLQDAKEGLSGFLNIDELGGDLEDGRILDLTSYFSDVPSSFSNLKKEASLAPKTLGENLSPISSLQPMNGGLSSGYNSL